jgi:hypothetical protein
MREGQKVLLFLFGLDKDQVDESSTKF